jgi:hypothetical protein
MEETNENDYYLFLLGSFELESGKLIVSDPAFEYKPEEHAAGSKLWKLNLLIDAKPGKWHSFLLVRNFEKDRNADLICFHESEKREILTEIDTKGYWSAMDEVGVDTGQVGIYDLKYYRDDNVFPDNINDEGKSRSRGHIHDFGELWYEMNCNITMKPTDYAGIIPYGVVSSSGYGDGFYPVLERITDDVATAVRVVFIEGKDEGNLGRVNAGTAALATLELS